MRVWKIRKEHFEPWAKNKRVSVDLRYDTFECMYLDLDTEWLWTAYLAGWNDEKETNA